MLKWPLAILTSIGILGLATCKKKASEPTGASAVEASGARAQRGLAPLAPGSATAPMGSHDPAPTDPHAGMDLGQGSGSNPHAGMDLGQGGDPANPHAGMDLGQPGGSNPHAGMDLGQGGDPANPHAGMDLGGSAPANPHAGMGAGADPHGGGAAASDPDLVIEGTVALDPQFKDKVPKGSVVFLSARSLKSKSIVAVDRLVVDTWPLAFKLDAGSSMMGGAVTLAKGDKVLLDIVVDKDGDPMKKQGEVEAMQEVTVPGKSLALKFDHIREAP